MSKYLIILIVVFVLAIAGLSIKLVSAESGGSRITLTTDPNPLQLGQANFLVTVKDKDGKLVDDATVSFDLNMTTMNMGVQQGNATAQGNGKYLSVGRLTMLGPWRFSVNVNMPDSSVIKKDFDVSISR